VDLRDLPATGPGSRIGGAGTKGHRPTAEAQRAFPAKRRWMGSISPFNRPSPSADCGNWRISPSSEPARALVFLGPPGTGKTHLSLALAHRALTAGYSVLFTTLADLAQALQSASHPGLVRQRLRRYIAPHLLVIDEVGYTKLSQEQAHHFFELVTARYEHGSIILTSNTSFAQWGNLLGDEVLATALLDRLLHHAEVIPINGRSYRMKERQADRTGLSVPPEVALGATGGKSTGVR
jgi:chromosomal replication initiation ATPase DnaA